MKPLLEHTNASGVAQDDYIYLNGRPVAVLNGATLFFLRDDMLGTPQLATDANQAAAWQASYDAFGLASVSGTITQNLRLPGQYFDVESGWNHNGFRDYAPQLGRYIEPDPLGRLGSGNNSYAYAGDNPANLIDPLGLCPNNGRTTCRGTAMFTGVGGNQAKYRGHSGALYSNYPTQAGGSIAGGAFGTVAVQDGFLGLSTSQLRTYGTQILITPSNQGLFPQYGGPTGPLSVSDYGGANIQATPGVAFDVYRFPTVPAGMQFGRRTMSTTISFPNSSGASCPPGFTVVP